MPQYSVSIMHRSVVALALCLSACNAKRAAPEQAPEPVAKAAATPAEPAAKPAEPAAKPGDAFCARSYAEADAPAWQWPVMATPAPADSHRWRWVNVWASWCEPCLTEAPMLVTWRDKLVAAGKAIDLTLIALDDSDAAIARVMAAHPKFPATLRLADKTGGADLSEPVVTWISSMISGDSVSLPLHALVSPAGKLRCLHVGDVEDKDYAALAAQITP